MTEQILRSFSESRRVVVASHENPDGDAVSSLLAVGLALEKQQKNVTFYNASPIPAVYRFLPSVGRITSEFNKAEAFDTAVILDCGDLEPQSTRRLDLPQQTGQRGWMELEPFRVENSFPLGLFRAWSVIIPRARCLVYPEPAGHAPPLPRTGRGEHGAARRGEGEHFHGLREYQPGDPIRQIAWRTSARHEKLYSRQMESPSEEACELNWYLMGGGDTEEKLSILAAWILRAERRQIPYSLEMPGDALPADLGDEHRDACLKILALFQS